MIRIITIEREYGCGAATIARELAARLDWKLWDQLLTREIARLTHCDQSEVKRHEERRDPLYYRLLKSFTLGSYEGNSNVSPVETLDADSIVNMSKRVVEEAAAGGDCIIVGEDRNTFSGIATTRFAFFSMDRRKKKYGG